MPAVCGAVGGSLGSHGWDCLLVCCAAELGYAAEMCYGRLYWGGCGGTAVAEIGS